jgi:hypothetical protein
MSEQELIRALQDLISRHSPPVPAHELSLELRSRDRWRVGLLAASAALLWLGGITGVLYMVFWFNRFIILYSPEHSETRTVSSMSEDFDRWRAREEFHAKMELHHSLEACMVAVPVLLLAALCTVWLVFSSRRATLNQINVSLAEIARELQEMRQAARAARAAPRPSGGG